MRDLTQNAQGNQSAVYTRIYTAVFFETSVHEAMKELIGTLVPSLAMLVLSLLLKEMKLHVATLLAVIVLLFGVDSAKLMTTTVRVLSGHLLAVAVVTVISRDGQTTFSSTATWSAAATFTVVTAAFVAYEYRQVLYICIIPISHVNRSYFVLFSLANWWTVFICISTRMEAPWPLSTKLTK